MWFLVKNKTNKDFLQSEPHDFARENRRRKIRFCRKIEKNGSEAEKTALHRRKNSAPAVLHKTRQAVVGLFAFFKNHASAVKTAAGKLFFAAAGKNRHATRIFQ